MTAAKNYFFPRSSQDSV